MADLSISIDIAELDKAIEKAERLRDILRECRDLEEPEEEITENPNIQYTWTSYRYFL